MLGYFSKVVIFMIFSDGIDKTLYLILANDKKNRGDIANLIYNIPKDLIVRIQDKLKEIYDDNSLSNVELCKAVRDSNDITSMYKILVFYNGVRIKLSRWNNQDEWVYDLELCDVNLDEYIGSYFSSETNLFLGIGPMIVVSDGIGYELHEDNLGNKVMELSGNRVNTKIIDKLSIPTEICLDDLSSMKNVRKLVNKRWRSLR